MKGMPTTSARARLNSAMFHFDATAQPNGALHHEVSKVHEEHFGRHPANAGHYVEVDSKPL